jgi:tetratricopeptide (TPR) repeat protein
MFGKRQMTPELANSIGYTAAVLGIDMAKADKLLKFAVESAPFNSAYLDSLAWLCFRRQLYAEAQTYIDRALAAVDPNTPAATLLEHAGDIYRAQGNFYQAEKFYRRALEFSAGDPECDPARVEKKLKEFK